MNQETNIKFNYRVSKISTSYFNAFELPENELTKLFDEPGLIGLQVNTAINISTDAKSIAIDIESELSKKVNKELLIAHKGRTIFSVDNLQDFFKPESNSFNLPSNVLVQLFSLAYTHARALIAIEISPTVYKDKFFLPIVDPNIMIKAFLNNDSEVVLKKE
jgi:hypothetical protein